MKKVFGFLAFYVQALRCGVTATDFNPGAYFHHRTTIIPHDDKRGRGGEDAAAADQLCLAVADGVGGWAQRGIDPGLFSKALVKTIVERNANRPTENIKSIIFQSSNEAQKAGPGTSTLVVVRL